MDKKVLVVGNHVTSLNIIRQLGKQGIDSYLTHTTGVSIGRYSKYCKGFFKCPPFTKYGVLTEFLINLTKKNSDIANAILIPTNDDAVYAISQNKNKLEKYFTVPVPEWEIINRASDKRITLEIAKKAGVPIPKAIFPRDVNDMLAKIGNLKYPVVVKPAMGKKYYFAAGIKMHMANNIDEVKYYFDKVAEVMGEDKIIVQEYIPGPMTELYNYSTVMRNGEPNGIYTGKKLRQHPRDFGVGTAAKTVHDPVLSELGTRLFQACDYEGVGYIEFKKDPRDNHYKLIEINPRLWNFMDLAYKCGVDLPLNIYNYANNLKLTDGHIQGDMTWIHFWADFGDTLKEVLKGNESIFSYLKSLKGKKTFAVASFSDPLPFIMETLFLPYLIFKR